MEEGFINIDKMNIQSDNAKSIEYAQVVFHNVVDSYSGTLDIQCCYTLTECILPKGQDSIGIYKLGWTKLKDFECRELSPMPPADQYTSGTQFENQITFQVSVLPKDVNEFYQFVYVHDDHVSGASTPFQCGIKSEIHEGYVGVEEEEDDIIVIKKKSDALTDDLENVIAVKNKLLEEGFNHQSIIDSLRNNLIDAEHRYSTKISEFSAVEKCWKECEVQLKDFSIREKNNLQEKNKIIMDLNNIRENNSKLNDQITILKSNELKHNVNEDTLSGRVNATESKVFQLHEHISQITIEKQQVVDKNYELKQDIKLSEVKNNEITKNLEQISIKYIDIKNEYEEASKLAVENKEGLEKDNEILMDKFTIVSKGLADSQIMYQDSVAKMTKLLIEFEAMKLSLKENIHHFESSKEALHVDLYEKSAALYSLQVALKMLREKLARQQCELEKRCVDKTEQNRIISEYKNKLIYMNRRLEMARKQYEKIYLELCRQQRSTRRTNNVKVENEESHEETRLPPPIQPEILRSYDTIKIPQNDAIPMPPAPIKASIPDIAALPTTVQPTSSNNDTFNMNSPASAPFKLTTEDDEELFSDAKCYQGKESAIYPRQTKPITPFKPVQRNYPGFSTEHRAININAQCCPICEVEMHPYLLNAHIQRHYTNECPMCQKVFDSSNEDYAKHVHAHFE